MLYFEYGHVSSARIFMPYKRLYPQGVTKEVAMEQTCPKCGKPYKEGAIYCTYCGNRRKNDYKACDNEDCVRFGEKTDDDDIYCRVCGRKLEAAYVTELDFFSEVKSSDLPF
jgi:hypothetical protein